MPDQRQLERYGQPMVQQQLRPVTFERLPGTELLSTSSDYEYHLSKLLDGLGVPKELYDPQSRL